MNYDYTLKFVYELFKDKKDKSNKPYVDHLIRVSSNFNEEKLKIISLLHDTIEDTDVNASKLLEMGYEKDIVNAVELLTNTFNSYDEFIDNIINSNNELAIKVKLKDLEDNMNLSRLIEIKEKDIIRNIKYEKAYNRLKECLKNDRY